MFERLCDLGSFLGVFPEAHLPKAMSRDFLPEFDGNLRKGDVIIIFHGESAYEQFFNQCVFEFKVIRNRAAFRRCKLRLFLIPKRFPMTRIEPKTMADFQGCEIAIIVHGLGELLNLRLVRPARRGSRCVFPCRLLNDLSAFRWPFLECPSETPLPR